MIDPADAATLRLWAISCEARADDPTTSWDERRRLLKMRSALLELADTEDSKNSQPQEEFRRTG